ncbi:MAG: hypothetical protein AAF488_11085, partial [Planctomycetota bacterium]
RFTITASADTRGQPLRNLFSNFNNKDPFTLFRRLDPARNVPTYGDGSTVIEDAPTAGKFYLRVEDQRSRLEWGSFQTKILESDFGQIDRSLYGGRASWRSEATTRAGEARTRIDGFAAEAGTIPAREEFRGTGGSLYYLEHRDITQGSDQLRIEIRDKDSGLVVETTPLVPGRDYDLDPIQGRLILSKPLPSTADDFAVVRTGLNPGDPVYLVVRYEYTPLLSELKDLTFGGRASHWLGEHVRFGVTTSREDLAGFDHSLYAGDAVFQITPRTYLSAEVARTEGLGRGASSSIDGGFRFSSVPQDRRDRQRSAQAFRVEAVVDGRDVFSPEFDGRLEVYWQHRDRGFSAPGQWTDTRTREVGGKLRASIDEKTRATAKFDERIQGSGVSTRAVSVDLERDLDRNFSITLGSRSDWLGVATQPTTSSNQRAGLRTDVAGQLTYNSRRDWDLYGFSQVTVARSGRRNPANRGGLGGHYRVAQRWKLGGEASGGNGGLGLAVEAEHQHDVRTHSYLTYRIDPTAIDGGWSGAGSRGQPGTVTLGSRRRFDDGASVFSEQRATVGGDSETLTHAIGMDLTPQEGWTVSVTAEDGVVVDRTIGELERQAFTISSAVTRPKWSVRSAIEGRFEEDPTVERTTWLLRNQARCSLNPSWTGLAQLNWSVSHTDQTDFIDGDFTELVLGAAHRPIDHDRWSTLFQYTYFANLPASSQVSNTGVAANFEQESHVFAVDTTVRVTERISVGSKFAVRVGRLRNGRSEGRWHSSTAHLGVVRSDVRIFDKWDALGEVRFLEVHEAEDRKWGALLGVSRRLNDHLRLGAGYDFSQFTDDLTDLDYRTQGWFLNLNGTF